MNFDIIVPYFIPINQNGCGIFITNAGFSLRVILFLNRFQNQIPV